MADAAQARLETLEWLLDVAIDRLTAQPGPRDQVYMVLKARLTEAELNSVMDIIAALQARVGTANPPTQDEILTTLGNIRPRGIGAGPVHFVGELLSAFEATQLLPIWKPEVAATTATVAGNGGTAGPGAAPDPAA